MVHKAFKNKNIGFKKHVRDSKSLLNSLSVAKNAIFIERKLQSKICNIFNRRSVNIKLTPTYGIRNLLKYLLPYSFKKNHAADSLNSLYHSINGSEVLTPNDAPSITGYLLKKRILLQAKSIKTFEDHVKLLEGFSAYKIVKKKLNRLLFEILKTTTSLLPYKMGIEQPNPIFYTKHIKVLSSLLGWRQYLKNSYFDNVTFSKYKKNYRLANINILNSYKNAMNLNEKVLSKVYKHVIIDSFMLDFTNFSKKKINQKIPFFEKPHRVFTILYKSHRAEFIKKFTECNCLPFKDAIQHAFPACIRWNNFYVVSKVRLFNLFTKYHIKTDIRINGTLDAFESITGVKKPYKSLKKQITTSGNTGLLLSDKVGSLSFYLKKNNTHRWVRNNYLGPSTLSLNKQAIGDRTLLRLVTNNTHSNSIRNVEPNNYVTLKQKKIEKTTFSSKVNQIDYGRHRNSVWHVTDGIVRELTDYQDSFVYEYRTKKNLLGGKDKYNRIDKSYPYQKRLLWVNKQIILPVNVAITVITNSYDVTFLIHSRVGVKVGLRSWKINPPYHIHRKTRLLLWSMR